MTKMKKSRTEEVNYIGVAKFSVQFHTYPSSHDSLMPLPIASLKTGIIIILTRTGRTALSVKHCVCHLKPLIAPLQ